MATVHETVISARATITGLGSSLGSFVMGEKQLIAKYDAALEEAVGDKPLSEAPTGQRAMLQGKTTEMECLAE